MANSLRIALPIALLLLVACRSEPIHYHTLTPAQSSGGGGGNGPPILIESISVPPQVDRSQIVIRQGNTGLLVLETEWWGASLVDELKIALADQLDSSYSQRAMSLRVDVQRFDSIPGQYARMDVAWRLRFNDDEGRPVSRSCRTTAQTGAGLTIDELVAAHQNNVKRLVGAIMQEVDNPQNCPSSSWESLPSLGTLAK